MIEKIKIMDLSFRYNMWHYDKHQSRFKHILRLKFNSAWDVSQNCNAELEAFAKEKTKAYEKFPRSKCLIFEIFYRPKFHSHLDKGKISIKETHNPWHNQLGLFSRATCLMFFPVFVSSNIINCQCVYAILQTDSETGRGRQ